MSSFALSAEQLRRVCSLDHFQFETTAELEAQNAIIGQPRGTRAIEFGIGIRSQGYNVFVLGETGTGRITAIRRFLRHKTSDRPIPPDWVYVHNFATPHRPRTIRFAPGKGSAFKLELDSLLVCLREDLPKAFENEAYRDSIEKIRLQFEDRQSEVFAALQAKAQAQGYTILRTAAGLDISPVIDGQVMTPEMFQQLPAEQQRTIDKETQTLNAELDDAYYQIRQFETETRQAADKINRQVAETAIDHIFTHLRQCYQEEKQVLIYLDEVYKDVLDNVQDFLPNENREGEVDLRRYTVNLVVDNSQTSGVPVIFEANPTYANLIGRIEYEMVYGAMTTHFTNIKAGSLHAANGGYLVINARDLLQHEIAWETLKRALKEQEIQLQSPGTFDGGNQVLAKSLDPEPIPLAIKVILLGNPRLYYMLYEMDEDFGELFKVKADFHSDMPRNEENEMEYAQFIASRCQEEKMEHFDRSAVAKVIEHGSRLSAHQEKLTTRFGLVTDVVREANYWASQRGAAIVTAADVNKAIEEQVYRANEVEERIQEQFDENIIMVTTEGHVVGQVNGLSVLDLGDYAFGQPSRITAQTYMGEEGVVNIDREVEMAGPLHNKGLLTLVGYLGGTYAQDQPLSLSASLAFEQNYGGVDGDSASSAELYALLSSLSGVPVNQGRAVTGSVNQRGEIQPIGGVTEKIEGFFTLCKKRGLTGDQGVLIPVGNVKHIMVHEEVVEAVRAGQFHVWAVRSIDDGIELLMGKSAGKRNKKGAYPEGSIHYLVQARLRELAEELKQFGESDDNPSQEEDAGNDQPDAG